MEEIIEQLTEHLSEVALDTKYTRAESLEIVEGIQTWCRMWIDDLRS